MADSFLCLSIKFDRIRLSFYHYFYQINVEMCKYFIATKQYLVQKKNDILIINTIINKILSIDFYTI